MGNLLKPVFGGSCTQLHSPALIAVQQSDTDKTDLGPVNTLTLDSQHYRLQLSMAHSVMMDTWIIQSRAVVAWDMLPCWRRDKLDTHLLFDNFLNNLQPVTLFLPVTDSAHSDLSITRTCDMHTHASLVSKGLGTLVSLLISASHLFWNVNIVKFRWKHIKMLHVCELWIYMSVDEGSTTIYYKSFFES